MSHNSLYAKQFRQVHEGFGGTYRLQDTLLSEEGLFESIGIDRLRHIGTDGCWTCVGVYFRIDSSRCFCAHINAVVLREHTIKPLYTRRIKDEAEGARIKDEVLRRLSADAAANEWSPKDIATDKLVLVCPSADPPNASGRGTGSYVIEAICEFLGVANVDVDRESEGFVVCHATFEVAKIAVKEQTGSVSDDRDLVRDKYGQLWETRVKDEGKRSWEIDILRN